MPQATFSFPAGFLWGTATAAHQVEGGNTNNNWSAWENLPGKIKFDQKAGLACDWWGGRWKEDMDRAAETGQNAHRFSVEWSRIQPAPDRWDEGALDRYRSMAQGMVQRGITPMVTLHHFTDPIWLMEQGGWENDDTPQKFAVFTRRVVEALKEYVTLWVTINEPNVYATSSYVLGDFPPGKHDLSAAGRVLANLVRGHAAAYAAIHQVQKEARVGYAHHHRPMHPANTWNPLDRGVTSVVNARFNHAYPNALATGLFKFAGRRIRIPQALKTQDYFGLNYYTQVEAFFIPKPAAVFTGQRFPKGAQVSQTEFMANVPSGFFESLKWASRFGLPILITENGVNDADDSLRPPYLVEHLHQLWRAINFNWQIKGYFHWSLVDNFEWERGWTQRFGLWGLDPETQARTRRPSVDLYAQICHSNSLSSDMVQKFAPEVFSTLFPG
jgi:beta-glucosidase